MKFAEISILNHSYALDPNFIQCLNQAHREEVAAPSKIWRDGNPNWRPHPDWSKSGPRANWFVTSEAYGDRGVYGGGGGGDGGGGKYTCILMAPEASLAIWPAAQSATTVEGIFEFLCSHWDKRFIVSYPILEGGERVCGDGSAGGGGGDAAGGSENRDADGLTERYTMTYGQASSFFLGLPRALAPSELLRLIVNSKAFTVANGLILAIALHRLGIWSGRVFQPALQKFVQTRLDVSAPWTFIAPFQDEWAEFYSQHIVQICDFPMHYVIAGGAEHRVIAYLIRASNDIDPIVQQMGVTRGKYTSIFSTAFSASPPPTFGTYQLLNRFATWPVRCSLHTAGDVSEPDWYGFARACVMRGTFWREWRKRDIWRRTTILRMRHCCTSDREILNMLLQPLFRLHTHPDVLHPSRVRRLWRDVLQHIDITHDVVLKWLRCYLARVRMTSAMAVEFPQDIVRSPVPPVAFMKDVILQHLQGPALVRYVHRVDTYRFSLTHIGNRIQRTAMEQFIQRHDIALNGDDFVVKESVLALLGRLAPLHAPAAIFLKYYLQRPALHRLLCLYQAFGLFERDQETAPAREYAVGQLVLRHFQQHREDLYG